MNALTARAYAKINLTLDVFSKRADGYHSLASIMQAVSLHDTLTIALREMTGVGFTCDGEQSAGVPTDGTNLVVRAAQAVLDVAHAELGLQIYLHKRIPSQAGLGGGSSDAAATLLGVTALTGFDLGPKTLHDLAAALGSDVPFFLSGGTAVVRGRGENISPIADAPSLWLVIVKPEESVSTGWAYGQLDADAERSSHRATKRMEEALRNGDIERLIAWQSNDFELPVFAHFPQLAWLHDELRMAGALTAHLCGSGSAVYGVFASEVAAKKVAALLESRYSCVFVARTLSRVASNPLRELGA